MADVIHILPDSVANQIAAGEVVDRPASAVKELLENAIDAGATHVQLNVREAGSTLIQVIDNGCGMSDSDARLCFERHATSKIHKADDLFALHTMGFRGEALASIAAISQVEMKSRQHGNDLGTLITIEGGIIQHQEPCSCALGTSLSIKNLFYNLPARRNFLKKESVELSHIEEIFKRVVLVYPSVGFTFTSNGKTLYDLQPGNLAQRIAQLYGNAYKERFYPVEEQTEVVSVKGYVGKSEYVKKTRGEQYLFVNGRFIKHPALSTAVEKAYSDLIPDRHYPSYFLMLEVDPARIDVNIHPTKTEVKFADEHAIFAILRAATKKALGQFSLATELEFNPSEDIDFSPAPANYIPPEPQISYNRDFNPFDTPGAFDAPGALDTPGAFNTPRSSKSSSTSGHHAFAGNSFTVPTSATSKREVSPSQQKLFNSQASDSSSLASSVSPSHEHTACCMQVQGRWIVSSLSSGLLVVDQQRAHERILFERLMNHTGKDAAQQLLFPVNCSFSPADAEMLSEMMPSILERGFEISPIGRTTFVVTATPTNVRDSELQQLFEQMIADYKNAMLQKDNDRNTSLCRTLARQMAVRPGTLLQQEEMQQMIADLFCCKLPDVSPSGKKTLRIIPLDV